MDSNTLKFLKEQLNEYYNIEKKDNFLIKYRDSISKISSKSYSKIKDMNLLHYYNKTKTDIDLTKEMAIEFLEIYFPEYLDLYRKLVNNGTINFDVSSSYERRTSISWDKYDVSINISVTNTIRDLHYIIHEFMHYVNLVRGVNQDHPRFVMAESVSIMSEFLVNEFLSKKGYSKEEVCLAFSKRLNLNQNDIKYFLKYNEILHGILNNHEEAELIKKIENSYFWDDVVDSVMARRGEPLQEKLEYIVGLYIASYFYSEKSDLSDIIKKLNTLIVKNFDLILVLKELGLDISNRRDIYRMMKAFDQVYDSTYNVIKEKVK